MLKKYLLGSPSQHVAGDIFGFVYAPPPAQRVASIAEEEKNDRVALRASSQTSDAVANHPDSTTGLRGPPDGTRAPRASEITHPSISSALRPPSIEVAPQPSPHIEKPQISQHEERESPWQDFEIPEELGTIDEDAPLEIWNIIQESFDEHKAMRVSRMQSNAKDDDVLVAPYASSTQDNCVVAESSAMAKGESASSLPGSGFTGRKDSSFSISQESVTPVGPETADAISLQAPKLATGPLVMARSRFGRNRQEQGEVSTLNSVSNPIRLEAKFQDAKDTRSIRNSKSRSIYSLFNRRMLKLTSVPVEGPEREFPPCECTSCFDEVAHEDAVDGLRCRHRYCRPCFGQLVNTAILNEDTFPPKCCLTEIPKTVMRRYLATNELALFDQKSLEYAVPLGNRYYCAAPSCARWIDTRVAVRTNGALECPHCQANVCTVCRGPQHPGNQDCPQDFGLDATLQEAEQLGWRRCYRCRAIVELNTGCRHITCKCRAEFCYTCGAVWRTCQCTEDDQRRREQELNQARVQREADARAEEEEVRRAIAAVEVAERQLREEREAEEARERERLQNEAEEITQREFERVERVTQRFAELRAILDHIGLQQKEAIEKRHYRQEQANDRLPIDFEMIVSKREQEINAEKDVKRVENDKLIKQLQKKHAAAIMEAIQRHRRDQDNLLTKDLDDDDGDPDIARAAILEELMPLQELERTTLKQQQAREIEKWKLRGERAIIRLNSAVKIQQMRFEEEEKVAATVDEFNRRQEADMQWSDLLHAERVSMLIEDERRLIVSGGDIGMTEHLKGKSIPGAFAEECQDG